MSLVIGSAFRLGEGNSGLGHAGLRSWLASRGEAEALDEASEARVAAQRHIDGTHREPRELGRAFHGRFIQAVERSVMVAETEVYLGLVHGRDVGRHRTRGQLDE